MTTAPILIVDDNRDACTVAARLLRSYGYEADVAYDGESALRLADQKFYALAIIDYQMPDMNGVELFRQMMHVQQDIVGVFLTGHATIDVVYPAIEAGIVHVFAKPVDFNELLPLVEEYVGTPT